MNGWSLGSKEEEEVVIRGEAEEKKRKKTKHYIEKQTRGNHRSVGLHMWYICMHFWNKSRQHSAA